MRLLLALLCVASACAAPLNTDLVMVEITRWEGHRLVPYKDGDGYSVGIGHGLTVHGEPVKRLYTRTEVRALFYRDLAVSLESARAGVRDFDDLPEDVRLVVLSTIWCVGPEGFMRFVGFRRALSHRAYNAALTELALSKWATQVPRARVQWAITILRSH